MSSVGKCLASLFYDHDCVVLPGFGGFIRRYKSARIHPVSSQAQPPCAVLAFNEKLKENDGLLISNVSVSNGVSKQVAGEMVRSYVNEISQLIQAGETITIHKVGRFRLDPEKKLQFIPDQSTDYLQDAFGLPSLEVLPVQKSNPIKHIQPSWQHGEKEAVSVSAPKHRIRNLTLAAAVLLLAILFIPFQQGNSIAGHQWANLFDTTGIRGNSQQVDALLYARIHPNNIQIAASRITTLLPDTTSVAFEIGDFTKALVSGAFREEANALKQLEKLRVDGYTASIYKQGSLHLVVTPIPSVADSYSYRKDFIHITHINGTWIKEMK